MSDPGLPRSTPYLHLQDALTARARAQVVDVVDEQVARSGLEASSGWVNGTDAHRCLDFDVDLRECFAPLESLLSDLSAAARREFDLPHFHLAAIPHQVTVHTPGGAVHSALAGDTAPGGRRIEFVYTFAPHPEAFEGGSIRLYDTVERDGRECAAETFTEIQPTDNALLMFPSSYHHEFTRVRAVAGVTGDAVCYTVSGWLAGDPAHLRTPDLEPAARRALQVHFLPKVSQGGFEVRPMPGWLHQLLTGLLELRGEQRLPEQADRDYHGGDDPDIVPIEDLADDILRRLKPLHEEWCDTELAPSAAYGMRCYRNGSRLEMHIDRSATHVVSSILQISQDVDEPWPLDLEFDGRKHAVLLSPGQMLLYEGASTLHGRPRPMAGRSFINLFVHYRPVDWKWSLPLLARRGIEDGLIDDSGRLL